MHPNRRVLTGTVIAVALLLLGACSKSDNTATTGTTAGTTAGSTVGTAAPGTPASKASAEDLKKWQTALNAVGCSAGPVDGVEGGETEAAIRAFQAFSGLTVDGTLGPQTEAALMADVKAGKKVCTGTTPITAAPPGSSSTTSTTKAPVTPTSGVPSCPPNCGANLAIFPGYGPPGTVVEITSAGTACTGPVSVLGQQVGTLTPQGMNKVGMTYTIPASAPPGVINITATACGATTYFSIQ